MGSIDYLLVILKGYTVALMDLCFQQYVCIKKGAVRLMLENCRNALSRHALSKPMPLLVAKLTPWFSTNIKVSYRFYWRLCQAGYFFIQRLSTRVGDIKDTV